MLLREGSDGRVSGRCRVPLCSCPQMMRVRTQTDGQGDAPAPHCSPAVWRGSLLTGVTANALSPPVPDAVPG